MTVIGIYLLGWSPLLGWAVAAWVIYRLDRTNAR